MSPAIWPKQRENATSAAARLLFRSPLFCSYCCHHRCQLRRPHIHRKAQRLEPRFPPRPSASLRFYAAHDLYVPIPLLALERIAHEEQPASAVHRVEIAVHTTNDGRLHCLGGLVERGAVLRVDSLIHVVPIGENREQEGDQEWGTLAEAVARVSIFLGSHSTLLQRYQNRDKV